MNLFIILNKKKVTTLIIVYIQDINITMEISLEDLILELEISTKFLVCKNIG